MSKKIGTIVFDHFDLGFPLLPMFYGKPADCAAIMHCSKIKFVVEQVQNRYGGRARYSYVLQEVK